MIPRRALPILLVVSTACPPDDPEAPASPYECSAVEASPDRTESGEMYGRWSCHWSKTCSVPDLDEEECIEGIQEVSMATEADDLDWCALEECVASVPTDTVCPDDAQQRLFWYTESAACRAFLDPEWK